jgi:hydroxybutyrate-dimer hydrolase
MDFVAGAIRETIHRGNDDLLSAGLGLAGLRGAPVVFADPAAPTPDELRRRAIQSNWKGIADLGPLGGYGDIYGAVPHMPGREYQAFARLPGARHTHRVLAQIPDAFDSTARCLVVTVSSGSRGVYGAISLAGAWGLPRGCAVAYTDKGAGTGYFDTASATGAVLDGTRAAAGSGALEFLPDAYTAELGIAIKHAHSGDNPEGDWGRHLLQAARFGLAMLERAYPAQAPFTPHNTRIIAAGLSNGAAAVLQAAGLDDDGWLDAAVAVAPNVNVPGHGRALYDYATEAGVLMPCALADARFAAIPFARMPAGIAPAWHARGELLRELGVLGGVDTAARADEALARLHAGGWTDAALATAVTTTAFELWRAFAVTYASAYSRNAAGAMPGGFRFVAQDAQGKPCAPGAIERAAWWCDAAGIAPGAGVFIDEAGIGEAPAADPTLPGQLHLRTLWTSGSVESARLRESVAAAAVRLPRPHLPVFVVHGVEDGLIPAAFSSDAYITWLRAHDRSPTYWPIVHAQHFDAFLALPGFGDRYVPLMPYAYAALDRVWARLVEGSRPDMTAPVAQARGSGALSAAALGL